MTQQTMSSTVTWCGTVRQSLTDVEKAILYHKHEAKRNKFFDNKEQVKYHNYMVHTIEKSKLLPKFD